MANAQNNLSDLLGNNINQQGLGLARAAAIQLHAMGTVVREIPGTVMSDVSKHYTPSGNNNTTAWQELIQQANTPTKRKRMEYAQAVDDHLLSVIRTHGLCANPVNPDFVNHILTGKHRSPDQTVLVGLKMDPQTNNFRYRPTSVVAWGISQESDYDEDTGDDITFFFETQNQEDELNTMVSNGEVAEIDLTCVCMNNDPHFWRTNGGGRALLAYVLGRIAQRKRGGNRRYNAVLTYVAHAPNQQPPLRRSLEQMGFVAVNSWKRRQGQQAFRRTGRRYYVLRDDVNDNVNLTWPQKVSNAIAWEQNIEAVCPISTGTGKSYCV